jgi:hypothetical protein
LGLKLAITPVGTPETVSPTSLLKPLMGEVEIVYLSLAPVLMVREAGVAHSEKSGAVGGLTKANMKVP